MMMMMIMIMVTKTRTAKIYPILKFNNTVYVLGITFIISILLRLKIVRLPNFTQYGRNGIQTLIVRLMSFIFLPTFNKERSQGI